MVWCDIVSQERIKRFPVTRCFCRKLDRSWLTVMIVDRRRRSRSSIQLLWAVLLVIYIEQAFVSSVGANKLQPSGADVRVATVLSTSVADIQEGWEALLRDFRAKEISVAEMHKVLEIVWREGGRLQRDEAVLPTLMAVQSGIVLDEIRGVAEALRQELYIQTDRISLVWSALFGGMRDREALESWAIEYITSERSMLEGRLVGTQVLTSVARSERARELVVRLFDEPETPATRGAVIAALRNNSRLHPVMFDRVKRVAVTEPITFQSAEAARTLGTFGMVGVPAIDALKRTEVGVQDPTLKRVYVEAISRLEQANGSTRPAGQ